MSQPDFATLNLAPALLGNLATLGYTTMTPIQAQSLPPMLAGRDVIAQGKTGSGKTAAFGLGLLSRLNVKRFRIQSLVLCPTRELADQVAVEIRRLARGIHNTKVLTLCGGMPFGPQVGSLAHGAHIIVGTPGRVLDHLSRGTLVLDELNTLVLDEADRMLDMGFQDALDAIMAHAPGNRQTLLFSATYPDEIKAIAGRIMSKPVQVQVAASHDGTSISQHFHLLAEGGSRIDAVRLLLARHKPESAVVFCNTKKETQELADILAGQGYGALALHGDLEQRERDQALVRFANKSVSVLVATDVAARGLDVQDLDLVVNYHLAHDPEVHVHRIGRTGRAGSKGLACSLYLERQAHRIIELEDYLGTNINPRPLPPAELLEQAPYLAPMATLQIDGGKRQKLRPGDILGALTNDDSISGKQVGKINVMDDWAYVAVSREVKKRALDKLGNNKLKGRSFRVRAIGR
ncbi:ATP-dependent RNA helicase DbpA [Gallaecimonas sp. GXIMD4217]|uniref:ATP-dependent RNA helicase DbpA n=1 Tax=Gallaecimonas sp. GXIMD4217 TaxID=3131927 RepID=UPI00311B2FBF